MHCRKAYGDPVWDQIESLYEDILGSNEGCESVDRFSELCPEISEAIQYTEQLINYATYGHLFYGAPECAQDVLGPFMLDNFFDIAAINQAAITEEEELDAQTLTVAEPTGGASAGIRGCGG